MTVSRVHAVLTPFTTGQRRAMDSDLGGKLCILESKLSWGGWGGLHGTGSSVPTPQTNVRPFGTNAATTGVAAPSPRGPRDREALVTIYFSGQTVAKTHQ